MSENQTRNYARIEGGKVVELFATTGDMTAMFSPELEWVEATTEKSVSAGWLFDGRSFAPPPLPLPPAAPPAPTLAELQAQLLSLTKQIAALGGND